MKILLKKHYYSMILHYLFLPMQYYVHQNYSTDNFHDRNFAIITNVNAFGVIMSLRARRTNSHFRYRPW